MKRDRDDPVIKEEDLESSGENESAAPTKRARVAVQGRACPWVGTINRQLLDFDFEKLCSVSLQNSNVYACLVCGKALSLSLIFPHRFV